MFSGIINVCGILRDIRPLGHSRAITITADESFLSGIVLGESIAVNGVCLTVEKKEKNAFQSTVQPRTVAMTTFSALKRGDHVNLERALQVSERLSGHIVQGHVDTVGTIKRLITKPDRRVLYICADKKVLKYVIVNASIAIDGISLTVDSKDRLGFEVHIIPFTYMHTTLQYKKNNDPVNIEIDMFAKYIYEFVIGCQVST